MKVIELMSELAEASHGNPDLEVEIHVAAEKWSVEAEMSEDVKAGESIITESVIDAYAEEFTVEQSECGGRKKICISASID